MQVSQLELDLKSKLQEVYNIAIRDDRISAVPALKHLLIKIALAIATLILNLNTPKQLSTIRPEACKGYGSNCFY